MPQSRIIEVLTYLDDNHQVELFELERKFEDDFIYDLLFTLKFIESNYLSRNETYYTVSELGRYWWRNVTKNT